MRKVDLQSNGEVFFLCVYFQEKVKRNKLIFFAIRYILSIYLNVRRFLDAGTSKRMGK